MLAKETSGRGLPRNLGEFVIDVVDFNERHDQAVAVAKRILTENDPQKARSLLLDLLDLLATRDTWRVRVIRRLHWFVETVDVEREQAKVQGTKLAEGQAELYRTRQKMDNMRRELGSEE